MVEGIDFLRLVYRFRSIRGDRKGFCGLNISELLAVMLIKERTERGEDINLSDLARELNVSKSAVSQLASKLERARIIRRVRGKVDKKIINLELTSRTRTLLELHEDKHVKLLKIIGERMGDELDVFMQASEKILLIMQQYYGEISQKTSQGEKE